jgi:hypothetical protein
MVLVAEERRRRLLDVAAVSRTDESRVREEAVASGDKNLQGADAADEEEAIKDEEQVVVVAASAVTLCVCVPSTNRNGAHNLQAGSLAQYYQLGLGDVAHHHGRCGRPG